AYTLASLPVEAVARTIGGVRFPAYVEASARAGDRKLRDGNDKLRDDELIRNDGAPTRDADARLEGALARAFTTTTALLTVVAVLLVLLADDAVRLLYGAKWAGAAPVLRVLAVVCFSRGLLQTLAPFVVRARARRRPRPDRDSPSAPPLCAATAARRGVRLRRVAARTAS